VDIGYLKYIQITCERILYYFYRWLHKVLLYLFFISKSKALEMFKYYKKKVKNQLNKKIKVIQSDKGGE